MSVLKILRSSRLTLSIRFFPYVAIRTKTVRKDATLRALFS